MNYITGLHQKYTYFTCSTQHYLYACVSIVHQLSYTTKAIRPIRNPHLKSPGSSSSPSQNISSRKTLYFDHISVTVAVIALAKVISRGTARGRGRENAEQILAWRVLKPGIFRLGKTEIEIDIVSIFDMNSILHIVDVENLLCTKEKERRRSIRQSKNLRFVERSETQRLSVHSGKNVLL